jgi:hypothetical protein
MDKLVESFEYYSVVVVMIMLMAFLPLVREDYWKDAEP